MRLTHLKLAGFKSFVDPTTLHIHGQRVGVVGPNGCGKSNVMESVRWVLGESSAKEMRGDSMDDVIFNGSGNRRSISRASVELVFDNSLGGAIGEWSQYSEISVKRVIERDKGSTYYINNTVVRRRDVADLFLGTGLGGRAYAIIGQNTINRIVEAKPEELRIFLEEAAGISKYKERRRETELRLRDTRENLNRVEDILHELDKQILHLQSQAEVAKQYHFLQKTLNITKGLVWLLKKRDAGTNWVKSQRSVEKFLNELEAQMANLRHNESTLEIARQNNFSATESVNQAQAAYYEANAEVSNLENQVKNTADARDRMQLQLQQLCTQLDKSVSQCSVFENDLINLQEELQREDEDFEISDKAMKIAQDAIPVLSNQYQQVLADFNITQTALLQTEKLLSLEQANIGHLSHSIHEVNEQLRRIQHNVTQILMPTDMMLIEKEAEITFAKDKISKLEALSAQLSHDEQVLESSLKTNRSIYANQQRDLNLLEAEISSLNKIQLTILKNNNEAALSVWLKNAGLEENSHLWQKLSIKSGWETSFESVLGTKLNAITHHELLKLDRPPGSLSLAISNKQPNLSNTTNNSNLKPLSSVILKKESNLDSVINEWLFGAYLLEEGEDAFTECQKLNLGEYLVNKNGDIYTQHSVTYFGTHSILHGVLERQEQLDNLEKILPDLHHSLIKANGMVIALEQNLLNLRTKHQEQNLELKNAIQQVHQLTLSFQQLKQQQANAIQQKNALQYDSELAVDKLLKFKSEITTKEKLVNEILVNLERLKTEKSNAENIKQVTEMEFNEARNHFNSLELGHQKKLYNKKFILNNINELTIKINNLHEETSNFKLRCEEIETTLAATKMETLKSNLETSLNRKQQYEIALIDARNHMSECDSALQEKERARMQSEQMLHPLRDKLEASRLTEQGARLHFEQCQVELSALNISELELNDHLEIQLTGVENNLKMVDFERRQEKLLLEINELGAVNLAAIQELESEQSRKLYLDRQNKDLYDASQTLEDAIRKIDRETRGRLQATFDEANMHFNELFTTLFGGGQARLELLGEEILDTGMQVFAQPPGKKNSTIHLLSGGEKALTALALVFALFRLNPAPFCLMDEVDAPLDDSNTERFCSMVKKMSEKTQFLYVSHNKITMEMAQQLIGVTMQESGVSRIVDVDMDAAVRMIDEVIT